MQTDTENHGGLDDHGDIHGKANSTIGHREDECF
jgi:hypothetical protein